MVPGKCDRRTVQADTGQDTPMQRSKRAETHNLAQVYSNAFVEEGQLHYSTVGSCSGKEG